MWVLMKARGVSDPLKLELYMVMKHITWLLGTELESSERVPSAFNLGAISSLFCDKKNLLS